MRVKEVRIVLRPSLCRCSTCISVNDNLFLESKQHILERSHMRLMIIGSSSQILILDGPCFGFHVIALVNVERASFAACLKPS